MPSSQTITSSDFVDFTTKTAPNNTISASEVHNNWSLWRGHIIPVHVSTSTAATTQAYDLGSSDYEWRNVYCQSITVSNGLSSIVTAYTTPASYPYSATSSDSVINYTDTAAATLTLPTATAGKLITVKKNSDTVTALTVDAVGSATIDGTTTAVLTAYKESIKLIGDASNNWHVIDRFLPFEYKSAESSALTITSGTWIHPSGNNVTLDPGDYFVAFNIKIQRVASPGSQWTEFQAGISETSSGATITSNITGVLTSTFSNRAYMRRASGSASQDLDTFDIPGHMYLNIAASTTLYAIGLFTETTGSNHTMQINMLTQRLPNAL